MPVMPIPQDWNGTDWACVLIEWPDSSDWLDILRGFVTTPLRGRFWDERSGSIIDVQAIGRQIEERNNVMSCDAIVAVLEEIRDEIALIQVSQSTQVNNLVDINNNVNLVASAVSLAIAEQAQVQVQAQLQSANAVATATAWSESFAAAITPIHITNVFPQTLRPISPADPPPTAGEGAETGVSGVAQSMDLDEICKRAYWLVKDAQATQNSFFKFRNSTANSVLAIVAMIADALVVTAARDPTAAPALMPIAALLNFAHAWQELVWEGLIQAAIQNWQDWLTQEFDNIVCILYASAISGLSTQEMQDAIMLSLSSFEPLELAQAPMRAYFNLTALATMYYIAPTLNPVYPPVPPGYDCELCIE